MSMPSKINRLFDPVRKEIKKDIITAVNKGRWLREQSFDKSVEKYIIEFRQRTPAGIIGTFCDAQIRANEIYNGKVTFNMNEEIRVQFKNVWDKLGEKPNWFSSLLKRANPNASNDDQEKTSQDES